MGELEAVSDGSKKYRMVYLRELELQDVEVLVGRWLGK